MRLQIVITTALVCGMVSLGCSDSETSGSGAGVAGGLDCDSSYPVPTSVVGRTVSAIVVEGKGELCDEAGVIITIGFGPYATPDLFLDLVDIDTPRPAPAKCRNSVINESFTYQYSSNGALGVLALFEFLDPEKGDYVAAMEFCQTSAEGGDYAIDFYDDEDSWQRGTFEFTN